MELKKLLMLGVAFLGVAGTTAVALSGQNVITIPETFAGGGTITKEDTLTQSTVLSTYEDPEDLFNYSIPAVTVGSDEDKHSEIYFLYQATWLVEVDSNFPARDQGVFYSVTHSESTDRSRAAVGMLVIGLNGVKDFSFDYSCGVAGDSITTVIWKEIMGPIDGTENTITATAETLSGSYNYDGDGAYSGSDGLYLYILMTQNFDEGASTQTTFTIDNLWLSWSCQA